LPLLNFGILQPSHQDIRCFLECHPTCQFRILFLPVIDVVYRVVCAQNRGKPLCETTSKYTVIHTGMYTMIFITQYGIYMKEATWCSLAVCLFVTAIIAVHVSDAFCVHLQEHLEILEAASGEWHETVWGIQQGVQGGWHPH